MPLPATEHTYAQIRGLIVWRCSECGKTNAVPANASHQYGRCKDSSCHRTVLFGLRVLKTGRGHKHRPTRDWRLAALGWSAEVATHKTGDDANVTELVDALPLLDGYDIAEHDPSRD